MGRLTKEGLALNLVENLCDVKALNILDPTNTKELKSMLAEKLSLEL